MNRRYAIKNLLGSLGALVTVPAWAHGWSAENIHLANPILSFGQEELLSDIVSVIIPEGEKQGAKSVGVPSFIQKLVVDCFEKKAQSDFKEGLNTVEKIAKQSHNQSFTSLSKAQKEEILRGMSTSADTSQKEFFNTIKSLTIQGYTTSEYVLVNFHKYEMAPGHFYGCVPV